jgi:hypothetical protein
VQRGLPRAKSFARKGANNSQRILHPILVSCNAFTFANPDCVLSNKYQAATLEPAGILT